MNYVLATVKDWNLRAFSRWVDALPGNWFVVSRPTDLQPICDAIQPRYVFFPHWSWKVPSGLLQQYECVCFHMTDVPYGRGGSPLQNLIERGHESTQLTALRMVDELDAGPVYAKRNLSLDGSAKRIYERAADIVFELMSHIANSEPQPAPQVGDPVIFPRRKPGQSVLPPKANARGIYDHIRMLDAPTYPTAFVRHGDWTIEFTDAELAGEEVWGRFRARKTENGNES